MAPLLTVVLLACGGSEPGGDETGDTSTGGEVDGDGDGWPDWRTASDPSRADCDDGDPAVTPASERYVPAGPFTRGRTGVPNAEPVRTITLSPYCIDRHEFTNAELVELLELREAEGAPNADADGAPLYDVADDDDAIPPRLHRTDAGTWFVEPGFEDHPAVEVWWTAAQYACARLGRTLPTEAQWEKAARGDQDARRWPWGDTTPTCETANHVAGRPCQGDTTPIATHPAGASRAGAEDLAGNVAEWVHDWFDPAAYETDADADPSGPAEGQLYDDGVGAFLARIARGGNYTLGPADLEVSARFPEPFDATSNGLGFRCARPLD